jgi:phosphatidylserine/phosphatidylglycerophosphate/cardiolipin synthase-like enzyme
MLHRFLDRVFGSDAPPASEETPVDGRSTDLVLSLPSVLRAPVEGRLPHVLTTDLVFRRLLETARRSLKIFSPYVDNSFTGMAQAAQVPIQVVTTLRDSKMKSSPVLERFATTRPLAVRYLCEKQGKSQMYQLHAKMILADGDRAYLGSANFTDTSLHYNFELGLYTEDREVIGRLHTLFDYVFDYAAKPAGQV